MDRPIGSTEAARTAREVVLVDPATGAPATPIGPSTGTQTSVADTTADTTLLAANSSRKGACVHNDSTAILYLLLGTGPASATAFSVKLSPDTYYELPVCQGGVYTGVIKGAWSADAAGAARVTELV